LLTNRTGIVPNLIKSTKISLTLWYLQ